MSKPESKAKTGGLIGELRLDIGDKVMLTLNVDISDGLVNGARGIVRAIIKTSNEVTFSDHDTYQIRPFPSRY